MARRRQRRRRLRRKSRRSPPRRREEGGQEVGRCGWRSAADGLLCPAKAAGHPVLRVVRYSGSPPSRRLSPGPFGLGGRPVLTQRGDLFAKLCLVTTRKERPARLTGRFYFLGKRRGAGSISSTLPAPCSPLPAPCSLLPAPRPSPRPTDTAPPCRGSRTRRSAPPAVRLLSCCGPRPPRSDCRPPGRRS